MGYPLYDITASGLTHSWSSFTSEPNDYLISPVVTQLHYGMIEIDWNPPVNLHLQLRDQDNISQVNQKIMLSQLEIPQ